MSHLALEQDKAAAVPPLGMYVHVPFCASTCDFCAFYQAKPTAGAIEGFLTGIADEARQVAWPGPVTTVFWGGGTPGLLAPRDLARLAGTVRDARGVDRGTRAGVGHAAAAGRTARCGRYAGVARGAKFPAGAARGTRSTAHGGADLPGLRTCARGGIRQREP